MAGRILPSLTSEHLAALLDKLQAVMTEAERLRLQITRQLIEHRNIQSRTSRLSPRPRRKRR